MKFLYTPTLDATIKTQSPIRLSHDKRSDLAVILGDVIMSQSMKEMVNGVQSYNNGHLAINEILNGGIRAAAAQFEDVLGPMIFKGLFELSDAGHLAEDDG